MHSLPGDKLIQVAMTIHIPPPKKWSYKHIILASLIGTLVAIAIAGVISISLSPAHIYLSIADANSDGVKDNSGDDTQYYNFTLVARNSSPRMAVLYGALNAEIWYSQTEWVPATVDMSVLQDRRRQGPVNTTQFNVSAQYWQSEQASGDKAKAPTGSGGAGSPPATSNTDWSNCTVVVVAKVWFETGGISTRSYNVRVSCPQVNFGNATAVVKCTPPG